MNIGPNGLALIKHFESCRLKAFKPIPTDPWTIGWGRTQGVNHSDTCSPAQADLWLEQDTESFAADVTRLVKIPISQNQFDALVSFAYNVGSDIDSDDVAEGLGDSTLLKHVNAFMFEQAADQFLRWNKSKGVVLAGLTRRREAERKLFLTPDNEKFML